MRLEAAHSVVLRPELLECREKEHDLELLHICKGGLRTGRGRTGGGMSSWNRTASRAIPTSHHLPEHIPRISRRALHFPSAPELRDGERNLETGRHGFCNPLEYLIET